jgi:hypothetical protein
MCCWICTARPRPWPWSGPPTRKPAPPSRTRFAAGYLPLRQRWQQRQGRSRPAATPWTAPPREISHGPASQDLPYLALNETHLARWRGNCLIAFGDPQTADDLAAALAAMDDSFTRAEARAAEREGTARMTRRRRPGFTRVSPLCGRQLSPRPSDASPTARRLPRTAPPVTGRLRSRPYPAAAPASTTTRPGRYPHARRADRREDVQRSDRNAAHCPGRPLQRQGHLKIVSNRFAETIFRTRA